MKVKLLSILLLLFSVSVFGQTKSKSVKPDSVRIRSEINDIEKLRQQLTEKIQKLKTACRQDSIGIVSIKNKKKDADQQTVLLKSGITDLGNLKDKTKDQKKLLKDLKQGHTDLLAKFAALDAELIAIEINYNNTRSLISDTENLLKDLAQKLLELRRLMPS